ncbi:unnamed protein product [Allacma fusca]|uniref:Uncharacterized protein n=1 Tax=Allacma fusca TaxID=39272 RepID=A0A8J2JKN9_9HEXA|nr:unnamed protein product [Allacma fusca]
MRTAALFVCFLALASTVLKVVNAQFGYGYRNWLGLALPINPMSGECLPDGSDCTRTPDCCSGHCKWGYPTNTCIPSPCGCPQPPWTDEPIYEICKDYMRLCYGDHRLCCTGYCHMGHQCETAPCRPCE